MQVLEEELQFDALTIEIDSKIGYIAIQACARLNLNGMLVCVER